MPTPRWDLCTCLVDGSIYAIGGAGPVYQALGSVEVYDPASNTWDTQKTEMPTARQGLSVSVVNGKVYAIGGGVSTSSSYSSVDILSTVEEYDPATDTWTRKADMPKARGFHSASVVDDLIYIIGGSHSFPFAGTKTLHVYDPATDTWAEKGDIPRGRYTGSFTGAVGGKIYVVGGDGSWGRVDEYSPTTDTWTRKTDMPTLTTDQSTSVLGEKIYVLGGEDGPPPSYPGMTDVSVYDPATDTWETGPEMSTGRFGLRSNAVDGKLHVMGGVRTWGSRALSLVEEFDPSTTSTDVEPIESEVPKQFGLYQNYPNPFSRSTTISYSIAKPGFVALKIYDLLGRELQTLVNGPQNEKTYAVSFDAADLTSGVYWYGLQADDGDLELRKMIVAR